MDVVTENENQTPALQQNQDRNMHAEEQLEKEITECSIGLDLELSDLLMDECKKRFSYSIDKVIPTSIFKTPSDFLNYHTKKLEISAGKKTEAKSLQDRLDIQAREKKDLFEEMIFHSRSANLPAYRKSRAAWSKL